MYVAFPYTSNYTSVRRVIVSAFWIHALQVFLSCITDYTDIVPRSCLNGLVWKSPLVDVVLGLDCLAHVVRRYLNQLIVEPVIEVHFRESIPSLWYISKRFVKWSHWLQFSSLWVAFIVQYPVNLFVFRIWYKSIIQFFHVVAN